MPDPVTPAAEGAAPNAARGSIKDALLNSAAPVTPAPAPADNGADAKPEIKDQLNAEPPKDAPVWAAGIPAHMIGETPEDTLAKLNEAYLGARRKLSEGGDAADVPEKPDGYNFELPEDYSKQFGDGKDDPLLGKFAERAHQLGIGQSTAQEMVNGFISDAMESGFYEAPMSMDDFYEGLGGEEAGGKIVGDVGAFIKNLAASGKLGDQSTEDGKKAVAELVDAAQEMAAVSPKAMLFLDALRKAQSEPGMSLPKSGEQSFDDTREGLRAAMKDPRYNPNSGSFDKAFRTRVDAAYDALDGAG